MGLSRTDSVENRKFFPLQVGTPPLKGVPWKWISALVIKKLE